MTTIHLDQVMGEVLTVASRNLVTRPTGAAVRDRVIYRLQDGQSEVELDFSRIGVVDYSCADEVVAKLLTRLATRPASRLHLTGVHPHHAEAIGLALDRQGLLVTALLSDSNRPCLLGAASEDLNTAFHALSNVDRISVSSLAELLDWPITRARAALAALAQHRCIVPCPDSLYQIGSL